MVMLAVVGCAAALFVLDSDTTARPAGAGHSRVMSPRAVAPPVTGLGDSVSVLTRIGRAIAVFA